MFDTNFLMQLLLTNLMNLLNQLNRYLLNEYC